ncbi:MAG: murein biosynthesis integral membrane protein MurJ [Candidatus Wallbacteria bacterium]|nr:murein biosynthesis integral membrane protein MurJ [Candidatus Wallbacteria bacterium]
MSLNLKNVSLVSFYTILSRLLGFARDMFFTAYFGTSAIFEAFIAAFQIPNFFRLVLGEGAMHGAIIPVYTEVRKRDGEKEAQKLASGLIFVLTFIFLGLIILVNLFTPQVAKIFVPGFSESPLQFAFTVLFLKIMFPYLLFIGLAALTMAFLNTGGRYAVPAFAPCLLNIAHIVYMLFILRMIPAEMLKWTMLAFTVIIGGAMQLFLQYYWYRRCGFRLLPVIWHPEMTKILKLFIPTALIFGTAQFNLLISRAIASFLPTGSITYLYYANRVLQLPLGIFSIAIVTVSLPSFSEASIASGKDDIVKRLRGSLLLILYLIIPATLVLYILPLDIISFIFERGRFDHASAVSTAGALKYYAAGLFFFSVNRLLQSVYYAYKNTSTPLSIAIFTLIFNVALNLSLMISMKHCGLALANSLAGAFQCLLLCCFLHRLLPAGRVLSGLKPFLPSLVLANFVLVLILKYAGVYASGLANHWRLIIILSLGGCGYLAAGHFTGLIRGIRKCIGECGR